MTPEREKNMRAQLADYAHEDLIKAVIDMQDVIDNLNNEKRGWDSAVSNLKKQNQALQERAGGDPEELAALRDEVRRLERRNVELAELNEGLQRKLIDKI